jgi:hypothetical protein
MREHGISGFPDPDENGHIQSPPLASQSEAYTAAARACGHYLDETNPSNLSPSQRTDVVDALLAFSRCMRAHGVAMSDPIVGQDSISIHLPPGISRDDPAVKSAAVACQSQAGRVRTVTPGP